MSSDEFAKGEEKIMASEDSAVSVVKEKSAEESAALPLPAFVTKAVVVESDNPTASAAAAAVMRMCFVMVKANNGGVVLAWW
jgi:hypothetical protein